MADQIPARGAPEPKVTPVEAAPAPTPSSLQQPQDIAASASKAQSPSEIRALIAQNRATMEKSVEAARRGQKPEGEVKPAPEIPPDLKEATQEETPAAEGTPETPAEELPAEGATPEQPEEGEDPDEDDGGDGPITPITAKRTHLRLPPDDKVGRLATSFMKRNRDMPMETAMEKARAQLGIKPKAETEAAKEEVPANGLPTTVEDTEAEIKKLRAERKQANVALEFEKASDLNDKIEDLLQHRFDLQRQNERKESEAITTYEKKFGESEAKAVDLYDFAGKPESEGGKRMAEIDAALQENGDPLYHSPDKPLRIAQMVAAELKIAPRRKGAPVTPAKAAAPTNGAPAPKKQVLPGGGSRTTPPPVNQPPAIDSKIKNVKSIHDLRNIRKELRLPV